MKQNKSDTLVSSVTEFKTLYVLCTLCGLKQSEIANRKSEI